MNVFEFLTPKANTFYLPSDSTIRQALEKLDAYKFSVVPLIDDNGFYVSTLSVGDILRYIKNNCGFDLSMAESIKVQSLEKYRSYIALPVSTPIEEIIKLSLEQNFVPIVDDRGVYIGIVKRKTIIDTLFISKLNKWKYGEKTPYFFT